MRALHPHWSTLRRSHKFAAIVASVAYAGVPIGIPLYFAYYAWPASQTFRVPTASDLAHVSGVLESCTRIWAREPFEPGLPLPFTGGVLNSLSLVGSDIVLRTTAQNCGAADLRRDRGRALVSATYSKLPITSQFGSSSYNVYQLEVDGREVVSLDGALRREQRTRTLLPYVAAALTFLPVPLLLLFWSSYRKYVLTLGSKAA